MYPTPIPRTPTEAQITTCLSRISTVISSLFTVKTVNVCNGDFFEFVYREIVESE